MDRSAPAEDRPATFGGLLKQYRLAARLTQEVLAERAGLSADAISLLERGLRTAPRKDTVARLADALGLSAGARRALDDGARRARAARQPASAARRTSAAVRDRLRQRARAAAAGLAAILVLAASSSDSGPTVHERAASNVITGRACAPAGILAPTWSKPVPAQSPAPALVRYDFEDPKDPHWSAFWHSEDLTRSFSTEHHYDGTQALRLQVGPGYTAVGTTSIDGLHPGGVVTIHIWYGGQGEGRICPWVEGTEYQFEWLRQNDLQLVPQVKPGWHTYRWTMPDIPVLGTGIQLNNSSANDFVVFLDAISW
jgi:transcriptional regulator with XRE-family HTH domain